MSIPQDRKKLILSQIAFHLNCILWFHNATKIVIALCTHWKVAATFLSIGHIVRVTAQEHTSDWVQSYTRMPGFFLTSNSHSFH